VTCPVGIDKGNVNARFEERKVIVTPVPENYISLCLSPRQYFLVINASVNRYSAIDMRLIFLPLLNGTVIPIEVVQATKALPDLLRQISIGHRVPDGHNLLSQPLQDLGHPPCSLALAYPGTYCGYRDNRLLRLQGSSIGTHQDEIRTLSRYP